MKINLHQIALCCIALLSCNVVQSCAFRSDYTYVESTSSYYKFHNVERANWHDANSRCRSEGAIMFHPENKDELEQVISWLNIENGIGWNIKSGFSDLRINGVYETVDGRPINQVYSEWATDEPYYGASQDYHCGGFMVDSQTIYVSTCDYAGVFICKYKPFKNIITTMAEKVKRNIDYFRSNYGYLESTDSYYRFYREDANWHDANSRCQSEGAIMFHPENKDELELALRAANVEIGIGWNIWSGFSDLRRNGFYETVDGRPLSQVYNKWSRGQPSSEHCGNFMADDKTIFLFNCEVPGPFMCKYKPINKTMIKTTNEDKNISANASSTLIATLKQHTEAMQQQTKNQTAASERIAEAMQQQTEKLALGSEQIAEAIKQQAAIQTAGLERMSEAMQRQAAIQAAVLERIAEAMQRQALALEKLTEDNGQMAYIQSSR